MSTAMAMGRYMWGSRASAQDMRLLWRHKALLRGQGQPLQQVPPALGCMELGGVSLPPSSGKQLRPGGSWTSGGSGQTPARQALRVPRLPPQEHVLWVRWRREHW